MKNLFLRGLKYIALPLLIVAAYACIGFSGGHYGLSAEDYRYVQKETANGELNFASRLDSTKTYTFNEKQYNYKQMALIMWGSSIRKMGVSNRHDAVALYEEITGVKLAIDDRKALITGFENK